MRKNDRNPLKSRSGYQTPTPTRIGWFSSGAEISSSLDTADCSRQRQLDWRCKKATAATERIQGESEKNRFQRLKFQSCDSSPTELWNPFSICNSFVSTVKLCPVSTPWPRPPPPRGQRQTDSKFKDSDGHERATRKKLDHVQNKRLAEWSNAELSTDA